MMEQSTDSTEIIEGTLNGEQDAVRCQMKIFHHYSWFHNDRPL